jgi:hypothetical protein
VQAFDKAISCGMVWGCPAEVDAAQLRQVLEKVGLELSSLIRGDSLWATKA